MRIIARFFIGIALLFFSWLLVNSVAYVFTGRIFIQGTGDEIGMRMTSAFFVGCILFVFSGVLFSWSNTSNGK